VGGAENRIPCPPHPALPTTPSTASSGRRRGARRGPPRHLRISAWSVVIFAWAMSFSSVEASPLQLPTAGLSLETEAVGIEFS